MLPTESKTKSPFAFQRLVRHGTIAVLYAKDKGRGVAKVRFRVGW